MKIKLERLNGLYHATLPALSTSSPTGKGQTKHDAIAHLFYLIFHSDKQIYLNHDGLEIIEDELSQPLYAKIHLSRDCEVELRLTGEVSQEAFNRLLEFLRVTGELWEMQVERQKVDNQEVS